MKYPQKYDVIVIGGGHAGVEAALASARMGSKTLLLTHNLETIGQMSCNPSMGGIGKGQLMKEIDALDGAMGWCADHAAIHMKVLNRSKGPAMHGHHGVLDRQLYRQAIRSKVENQENLDIFQQSVEDVVVHGDTVVGVKTQVGIEFSGTSIVVTAGTFLNGKVHVGLDNYSAGRAGEPPSIGLAQRLKELQLPQGRLKTGTPARIDARTIDFHELEAQWSDFYETPDRLPVFSFMNSARVHPQQKPCYITRTNEKTHEILRSGFDRSPMFTGLIEGVGPRYCPSIEDKITRFADKDSHQIILEPEGVHAGEYYPNGISTSLPFEVQYHAIRSLPGLSRAHLTRPGYAIEYDYYDPTSLRDTLQLRALKGLFLAGQCIGTTGYSEAAALGLVAGVNASLHAQNKPLWSPSRQDSYLGVMIDDITSKGLTEPYRMFTSRSEYRLHLREDNADLRLTQWGHEIGLVSNARWEQFQIKQEAIEKLKQACKSTWVNPKMFQEGQCESVLGQSLQKEASIEGLIKRPQVQLKTLMESQWDVFKKDQWKISEAEALSAYQKGRGVTPQEQACLSQDNQTMWGEKWKEEVLSQVDIAIKYEGYLNIQTQEIERQKKSLGAALPSPFDYMEIKALSTEVKQKLNKNQPLTFDEASRIPGVTPSALSILMVHMKKLEAIKKQSQGESKSAVMDKDNEGLTALGAALESGGSAMVTKPKGM